MGKTNRERIQKTLRDFRIKYRYTPVNERYNNRLTKLIIGIAKESVKRGRRKERKHIRRAIEYTTCPDCGGDWMLKETILPNGELGCSCKLPPFDTDKVRELINDVISSAYEVGKCYEQVMNAPQLSVSIAKLAQEQHSVYRRALLAALGFEKEK